MSLADLIVKFDPRRVRPAIEKAFDITEQDFVYENLNQLAEGLRPDGTKIARKGVLYYPYAPLTVALKSEKTGLSGVTDHVTLYDEGNFYAGIAAKRQGADIITTSKDEKADALELFYGEVLGVGNDGLNRYIAESFTPEVKNQLNL